MATYLLKLERGNNPDFYNLFDEYNGLIDRWNEVMISLHSFKMSLLNPWVDRKKISKMGKPIPSLQKDFLAWSEKVKKFCLEPNLLFPSGPETPLSFLHYTSELRDIRNYMDFYMVILNNDYNRLSLEIDHRIEFLWGMSLALAGLVLSLIGLWLSLSTIDF